MISLSLPLSGGSICQFLYTASLFIVISFLVNILLLLRAKNKNFKKLRDVYGIATPPITNPFFGHMEEYGKRENELKWHRELGKVFGFYDCDYPHLKISDINLINEVFVKQSKIFNARIWQEYRLTGLLGCILFNKGEDWKKIRRVLVPAMTEYRVRANDATNIHDIKCGLDKMVNLFKDLTTNEGGEPPKIDPGQYAKRGFMVIESRDSPTGLALEVNTLDIMQVITLDVIFRIAFSLDSVDVTKGADDENLKIIRCIIRNIDSDVVKISSAIPILRIFTLPYAKFVLANYYRKFIRVLIKLNSKSQRETDEDRAAAKISGQPRRIHNILWDEYKAGNLSKGEVRTNSMAVLIGGFETTAMTSSYVLWCIAKHADCKEKLRSDLLSYGVESKYLEMFIKEVMRMYPALPNFVIRSPHVDTKLAGFTVKKGMHVFMSVNSIHYDESIWENPHRFDPERFAEGKTYPPGAYAPFGLGHRKCVGYHLAMREMKTIVCELLTNFDIQLIAPGEIVTKCAAIYMTRPCNDIRLRLIPNLASNKVTTNDPAPTTAAVGQQVSSLASAESKLQTIGQSSHQTSNDATHQQPQSAITIGSGQQMSFGDSGSEQNKVAGSGNSMFETTTRPETKAAIIEAASPPIG